MRLRFFRRALADPPRPGRHVRLVAGPSVPGAAATLVAAARCWEQVEPEPDPTAAPGLAPVVVDPSTLPVLTGVSLGFADGAHIELAPEDPRARPFRAAAAALLEVHKV